MAGGVLQGVIKSKFRGGVILDHSGGPSVITNSLKAGSYRVSVGGRDRTTEAEVRERDTMMLCASLKMAEGIMVQKCAQPPEAGNGKQRILHWSFQEEGRSVNTLIFAFLRPI